MRPPFAAVAVFREDVDYAVAVVALNKDFAFFGCTSHAAFGFEQSCQFLQGVVGSHESADERHDLAGSLLAVEPDAQLLLRGRKQLGFGFFLRSVCVVGVGRVDHAQSGFPVVVCHKLVGRKVETNADNGDIDHKVTTKSEMRKEIVIELSYKGFSRASDYS